MRHRHRQRCVEERGGGGAGGGAATTSAHLRESAVHAGVARRACRGGGGLAQAAHGRGRQRAAKEEVQVKQVGQLVTREQAVRGARAAGTRGAPRAVHKQLGLGRKVCSAGACGGAHG